MVSSGSVHTHTHSHTDPNESARSVVKEMDRLGLENRCPKFRMKLLDKSSNSSFLWGRVGREGSVGLTSICLEHNNNTVSPDELNESGAEKR